MSTKFISNSKSIGIGLGLVSRLDIGSQSKSVSGFGLGFLGLLGLLGFLGVGFLTFLGAEFVGFLVFLGVGGGLGLGVGSDLSASPMWKLGFAMAHLMIFVSCGP